MSMEQVFAESDAVHRAQVLAHTWGHLHPKQQTVFPIKIVFSRSNYGGSNEIIRTELGKGLEDSPWLYEHMYDFVCKKARAGNVCVFDGTYRATKTGRGVFKGKVRIVKI